MPFEELYRSLFPSVSDKVCSELRSYLDLNPRLEEWLYDEETFEHLAQGDIVEALPACFINSLGEAKGTKKPIPAILISNTCDMSLDANVPRKLFYTIIPLLPFVEAKYDSSQIFAIKENTITDILYLPDVPTLGGNYIAQLDGACSISSEYVHKHLNGSRLSLTRNGFYYFMAKLSMHLTRPENDMKRTSFS